MREALRRHPDLFIPVEETNFVYRFWGNRRIINRLLREPTEETIAEILEKWAVCEIFRHPPSWGGAPLAEQVCALSAIRSNDGSENSAMGLWVDLMRANVERSWKRQWGDKSPDHTMILPVLVELFPKARLIHLVRDGRNVAASLYARSKKKGIWRLAMMCSIWRYAVHSATRMRMRHPNVPMLDVRFEDLTRQPERTLHEVCSFLNLEYDPAVKDFAYSNSAYEVDRVRTKSERGISAADADKWRSVIPERWHGAVNSFLGPELLSQGHHRDEAALSRDLGAQALQLMVFQAAWFFYRLRTGMKDLVARTGHSSLLRTFLRLDPRY